jgi:preprotein translocase subunit SecA
MYPVLAGWLHFQSPQGGGKQVDREALVAWARSRFEVDLDRDDLKNLQREEVQAVLIEHSRAQQQRAGVVLAEAQERVARVFAGGDGELPAGRAGGKGALGSLVDWLRQTLQCGLTSEQLASLRREELERRVDLTVEDRYRPEIRRMERQLILEILDTAWKDHLLAMDHLRSSVGLRGYAQVDPKVEYKREGMRMFEAMWSGVNERVTDLIFRMEQLDEGFVSSTWRETAAIKQEAAPSTEIAAQQQAAIEGSQSEQKLEPIRNLGERVGRNDPCPCGSGKKFKNCCMRRGGGGR